MDKRGRSHLGYNTVAAGLNVDTTLKTRPKSARWLTQRLDEIRSELKEIGITYKERERPGKGIAPKRIIRLAFLQDSKRIMP